MADQISNYTKPAGPRVIKKHKESDYTDPSSNWFKITTVLGGVSVYPAWELINEVHTQNTQLALAAVSIISARLWWKYCGLYPRRADKSWSSFWFWVDEKLDRHRYNKNTQGQNALRQLYPVVKIHDNGIVEFDNGHYCVYADLKPKRLTEEGRPLRRMFNKGTMDGLHDNQMVKFIATSKRNPRKQIVDALMKVVNKTGNKERAMHLNSIIQKILNDNTKVAMYRHYAMIGLGQHDNLDSAKIAKKSFVDGILVNLTRADMRPSLIENKRKLEKIFRESVSERVMF